MSITGKAGGFSGLEKSMVDKQRAGQETAAITKVPTWLLVYKETTFICKFSIICSQGRSTQLSNPHEACDSSACRFVNVLDAMQTEQQIAAETSLDNKCSAV